MKAVFFVMAILATTPAMASNLELAGDCKPAVEAAIAALAPGEVEVETVLGQDSSSVVVGYTRSIYGRTVSGQAQVVLTNVKQLPVTRNVFLIKCDVVSVQSLN